METQYQDASQEKAIVDRGYVEQPFFREGWSSQKGKKQILNVYWILASLWNIISLLLEEKTIDL
jgi:hypothetical protein